ncbi:HU family DNA-binding protein [hot springs metagenome]|uniref:HU family DNA-binding protein n=1 Tax=hot springs metagenome TaxID=433727 RepID=A0A5J4LBK7_9ZZZZ
MTKADMIEKISDTAGTTKASAERALDTVIKTIKDTVRAGGSINFYGLGTFTAVDRKARKSRNPKTGETIEVPAKKAPKFTPSKTWRNELNA